MIEIEELTKYYGERKAVGPLSFRIEQGEVVGLLGLNGAGKTTTLRMLASDLLPTAGTIRIDGDDIVEAGDEVRAKIGYLPDRPPLYGEMTVREFLRFAGKLRGMRRDGLDRRIDEVIATTDLLAYADEPIDTLSHGYRQRVGIAQAILHEPKLLLLDEPISGLDPVQIVEMRELVRSLRGKHTTLVSSHILSEISETCDRLLVIRDGEIIASGSEAELVEQTGIEIGEGGVASSPYRTRARAFVLTVRFTEGTTVDAFVKRLMAMEGVARVEQSELDARGEGNVHAFEIRSDTEIREALVADLVGQGFGILGLERSERELETAFLELTGKEVRS